MKKIDEIYIIIATLVLVFLPSLTFGANSIFLKNGQMGIIKVYGSPVSFWTELQFESCSVYNNMRPSLLQIKFGMNETIVVDGEKDINVQCLNNGIMITRK